MLFEKDILISYAHIDDAPLVEGEKGWISEFHRSLELRLAQLLGKKPTIWRDPKLQGNDYFSDEILSQLPQIALLVSVLSPRYVNSEWCLREAARFYEVSKQNIGVRVQNKSRIFKIIKTPVKREEHPEVMRDLLGYEFYRLDPETGRAKELSRIFGADNEQAYWQKLDDLAHDICELLKEMSTKQTSGDKEEKPKRSIYLCESTSDMKEPREAIKRELQQHGFNVLPDQALPLVTAELNEMVTGLLSRCSMSVHLVGTHYGVVPEGTQKSIIELQNEIAGAVTHQGGFSRIIWIPPGTKADDVRQQAFLNTLRTDANAQAGADLLVTSLEELKLTILGKLKDDESKKQTSVDQDEDGPPRVYVICDQPDLETNSLHALSDHLFQQGFEVILPVFEGDETQVRVEHQESLKICASVIIYFGAGNELWLRSKMRDLMKVSGYGRATPLTIRAVYLADPVAPAKERFRSHEVTVINGLTGFSGTLMTEFVEEVKKHGR